MGSQRHSRAASGNAQERRKRTVPEARMKVGKPESKKELLARLASERAEQEKEKRLRASVAAKSSNEFHFEYYSMGPDMRKNVLMTKDELRKVLKYVDSEISRSENKQRCGISKARLNKHIKYNEAGDLACVVDNKLMGGDGLLGGSDDCSGCSDERSGCSDRSASSDDNYESENYSSALKDKPVEDEQNVIEKYIEDLKKKRTEILEKLAQPTSKTSKRK